jgi:hypothetical protein
MALQFMQLKEQDWPKGLSKPVAVVKYAPEKLRTKCKVDFFDSEDDLDAIKGALIQTASGETFALVCHLHNPKPGTEIWVLTNTRPSESLAKALKTLRLKRDDLTWISSQAKNADLHSTSSGNSNARIRSRVKNSRVRMRSGVSRDRVGAT